MYGCGEPALIRPELLQLCGEQGRFDASIPSVDEQEMGDVVILDLVIFESL